MKGCRYCVQFLKQADRTTAEKKSEDCHPTENGENGEHLGTETERYLESGKP